MYLLHCILENVGFYTVCPKIKWNNINYNVNLQFLWTSSEYDNEFDFVFQFIIFKHAIL